MMIQIAPVHFLLMAVIASSGSVMAGDCKSEVIAEYSQHADSVRSAFSNVSYVWKDIQYKNDGTPFEAFKYQIKCRHGSFSVKVTNSNAYDEYDLMNPRYRANLGETDKGSKAIKMVQATSATNGNYMPYSGAYSHPRCGGRTYLDLLKHPNTIVISSEETVWRGHNVRRVLAEVGVRDDQTRDLKPVRYGMIFMPDSRWICCGFQVIDPTGQNEVPSSEDYFEYESIPGGWPILKSMKRFNCISPISGLKIYRGGDVVNFQRHAEPFPDSDFLLSSHGLPEPEGMTETDPRLSEVAYSDSDLFPPPPGSGTNRWIWIAGIAVVLLAVAVLWSRRRRSS
jgi:hypothetical protein